MLQIIHDQVSGVIDSAECLAVFNLTQSYIWRRILLALPTSALNRTFSALYEVIDKERYVQSLAENLTHRKGVSRMPTDREVANQIRERDLYNSGRKNRDYLFMKLENFNNREHVDLAPLTIEHIFPQNPSQDWRRDLNEVDYSHFEGLYLHRLGNLTLSGNNGALGNRSFSDKQNMNNKGGEQGYAFSRLWLNRDLKDLDAWTVEAFANRTTRLTERILDIWPYPDVEMPEGSPDSIDLVPVEDIESATNMQIVDGRIFSIATGPLSFADYYRKALVAFYERDAYRMRGPDVMNAVVARNIESEVRSPWRLASGYFIEMNLDSTSKLRSLQKLTALLDVEGELELALSLYVAPAKA